MEIKILKEDKIWIRSEDNEIWLVGCDAKGNLYLHKTQKRHLSDKTGGDCK